VGETEHANAGLVELVDTAHILAQRTGVEECLDEGHLALLVGALDVRRSQSDLGAALALFHEALNRRQLQVCFLPRFGDAFRGTRARPDRDGKRDGIDASPFPLVEIRSRGVARTPVALRRSTNAR
jgi:hypothetical protein